jgi:hypothetical protein
MRVSRSEAGSISSAIQLLCRNFWTFTTLIALTCAYSTTCAAQNTVSIASSVTISKSGLVYNRITNTFNTVVTISNSQSTILNAPVLVAVTNIQPSTVTLANSLGQDSGLNPYVAVSIPANGLNPGASVGNILLAFTNPTRGNFSYTLVPETVMIQPPPLPDGIVSPVIDSQPPAAAVVGKAMQYQPVVTSSEPSSLEFSLSGGPVGMSVNRTSGLIEWTPASDQVGDTSITLVVTDSSGQANQFFTVSVFGVQPLTSALISAAKGGTIQVTNAGSRVNGLSIKIPPGALSADTTITISELTAPPTFGGLPRFMLKGFQVEPEGTVLASPATVSLPYVTSEFGTTAGVPLEEFLTIYFLQTSTGNPQYIPGFSVNSISHTISAPLSHFSDYVATNSSELCAPAADVSGCSPTPSLTAPLWAVPTILVHGFQAFQLISGLKAGRATFGQLSPLLNANGVHAWRFDWDTFSLPFEASAVNLAIAMQTVENVENSPVVNLVAHSFGGIVVRSYLQGASLAPYQFDVNRVMTLGTPHNGIGGGLSDTLASVCAVEAAATKWPYTCYESATGLPLLRYLRGAGDFLRSLNIVGTSNAAPLPALESPATNVPYYEAIIGQRVPTCLLGTCAVVPDDGLITTLGNELCSASPNVCQGVTVSELVNPPGPDGPPLCHAPLLCFPSSSIPMADVENVNHPLWSRICAFVNCFQLLGTWKGTGDYHDGPGTSNESIEVMTTLSQTNNSLTAMLRYTEPGDTTTLISMTYTVTQTPGSNQFNFNSTSSDGSISAHGTLALSASGLAITGSGSQPGADSGSGSGTLLISPDGLTMSVTDISVQDTADEPGTTVNGMLQFSTDGKSLSGKANTADGSSLMFNAKRCTVTGSVTTCPSN